MSTVVFLSNNYITSGSMLSLSNFGTGGAFTQANNRLSGQIRAQIGHATLETRGLYTGLLDRDYVINVQGTDTDGTFAGTLWQWSDTGGISWTTSNLVPVVDAWVALSLGVEVRWRQASVSPQFRTGDTIQFRARCPNSVATLIDLVRNTSFVSNAVSTGMQPALVADLGTARTPQACAVLDHNLIAGTAPALWGSAASNFSSHETYPLIYQAGKMCILPTVTSARRYWALVMPVQSGQPPIELSEWYLGEKTVLSLPWDIGFTTNDERLADPDPQTLRYGPGRAVPYSQTYQVNFGRRRDVSGQDTAVLRALWRQLNAWQTQDLRPVFMIPDDTVPNTFSLVHWANNFTANHGYLDRYSVPPEFLEVIRSVA